MSENKTLPEYTYYLRVRRGSEIDEYGHSDEGEASEHLISAIHEDGVDRVELVRYDWSDGAETVLQEVKIIRPWRRIWIASDSTLGRMITLNDRTRTPSEIAELFGRGESGELIQIWDNTDTDRLPDHSFSWDSVHRQYVGS